MPPQYRRCTAETKSGKPCRAWAVHDTDPPRCAIHGARATGGAPKSNTNALTHGYYQGSDLDKADPPTINAILNDLAARQQQLSDLINTCLDHLTLEPALSASDRDHSLEPLITLFKLHGQNASRLGRLLRDRLVMDAAGPDRLQVFIDKVLDDLSIEWGREL